MKYIVIAWALAVSMSGCGTRAVYSEPIPVLENVLGLIGSATEFDRVIIARTAPGQFYRGQLLAAVSFPGRFGSDGAISLLRVYEVGTYYSRAWIHAGLEEYPEVFSPLVPMPDDQETEMMRRDPERVPGGLNAAVKVSHYVPPIDGRVMTPTRDGGQLITLSVGKQDGVHVGFKFTVYREDHYIGKVEVESVFDDTCSARIIPELTAAEIVEGDSAATRIYGGIP